MIQKNINKCIAIGVLLIFVGCSPLEMVKSFWGSSTRRLDLERVNAIRHTYSCEFDQCFNSVLSMKRKIEEKIDGKIGVEQGIVMSDVVGKFEIFLENREKGVIVVMKVPGNVDTTEVGIFFSRVRGNEIAIEVTSLSTSAKRKVAEYIDEHLSREYP